MWNGSFRAQKEYEAAMAVHPVKLKTRKSKKRKKSKRQKRREARKAAAHCQPNQSYSEYLATDLWQVIRSRVLRRDRHTCHGCGSMATQVHHRSYGRSVMEGRDDSKLTSVCRSCHEVIEFSCVGGISVKNSLEEANFKLDCLIAMRGPEPEPPPGRTATLTAEMLAAAISEKGGFSRRKLALIGVPWPPRKGWKKSVIGRPLPWDNVAEFLGSK
jgi:hypothetical protein